MSMYMFKMATVLDAWWHDFEEHICVTRIFWQNNGIESLKVMTEMVKERLAPSRETS